MDVSNDFKFYLLLIFLIAVLNRVSCYIDPRCDETCAICYTYITLGCVQ